MGFTGKVALITGGAQGLGEAFTNILLQHGAKVSILDVQTDKGNETLQKFQSEFGSDNVAFFKADVTSQEELEGAFSSTRAKFGGLDIVINNAGVIGESSDKWEKTVDINLKGAIRGTLMALDHLRTDKGGRGGVIVNVASTAGLVPVAFLPVYAATKSGVVNYSLSLAMNHDVTSNGVRINVLAPAFVDTQIAETVSQSENNFSVELTQQALSRMPFMTREYVATNMLELLDEEFKKHGQVMVLSHAEGKSYRTP